MSSENSESVKINTQEEQKRISTSSIPQIGSSTPQSSQSSVSNYFLVLKSPLSLTHASRPISPFPLLVSDLSSFKESLEAALSPVRFPYSSLRQIFQSSSLYSIPRSLTCYSDIQVDQSQSAVSSFAMIEEVTGTTMSAPSSSTSKVEEIFLRERNTSQSR